MTPIAAPIRPLTGYTTRMGTLEKTLTAAIFRALRPRCAADQRAPGGYHHGRCRRGASTKPLVSAHGLISPRSDANHRSGPKTESDPFARCALSRSASADRAMGEARGPGQS